MTEDEKIKKELKDSILTSESKEEYLNLLNQRIEDNRKAMGRLFLALILLGVAFPLLKEYKITEVSVGPFKISDIQIVILIIPTVFNFMYYKYIITWFDLIDQKRIYTNLTSIIFEIKKDSNLNKKLRSFSFTNSLDNMFSNGKMDFFWMSSLFNINTFSYCNYYNPIHF